MKKLFLLAVSLMSVFVLAACDKDEKIENPLEEITVSSEVSNDIVLPEISGNTIKWESSNSKIIDSNGKVNRGMKKQTVTLTAKLEVNGKLETKEFRVTVLPKTVLDFDFSVQGFASNGVNNRNNVANEQYRKVATSDDLLLAINDKVKVIEITEDINLGYKTLSDTAKKYSFVKNFNKNKTDDNFIHPQLIESGISQIEIGNVDGMTIFSKEGKTIKHAGFKLTRVNDLVIRNLKFDGIWQWEDSLNASTKKIGDYDMQGWSFFKVNFSTNVLFDHLTFGKSYDGLIDVENSSKGITIAWSNFESGTGSSEAYYKEQMELLEKEYKAGTLELVYYKYLRDMELTYEEIYELFRGQKKGFMVGGGETPDNDEWVKNKELQLTIHDSKFYNLQDRLPRLRGGSAHVYNVHVDNKNILAVQNKIRAKENYQAIVDGIKERNWKLAFTNQSMVTTNGGAIQYQNSIFDGVREIIKSNNKNKDDIRFTGKYEVLDSIYRIDGVIDFRGNSFDANSPFTSVTETPQKHFRWNTEYGVLPYEPKLQNLEELEDILNAYTGSGKISIDFLVVK